MGFRNLPQPFVCGVLIDDPTVTGMLRTMKLAEYDGADAFDLEIQGLDPDQRTVEALRPLFRNATRPIFSVYRRYSIRGTDFVPAELDEQARMQLQLDLIDEGSMGLDMELDTFDPQPGPPSRTDEGKRYNHDRTSPPREITHNPRAVEAQLRLIEEVHRRGGEVLASAHTLTRMTSEAALDIGRLAEARGADALKIVQFCASYEDALEALQTSVVLKRELSIPFVHMAMGEYGKLVRPLAPLFGSMLVFARHDYAPGSFLDQPPVRAMRALFDNVDFRITRRAENFL
ncbi:MAG: type I 3-dehydroquinate dehydratase, partial [Chloroflexi bacterium]|nr:type I 3-dehydroquinate dehydratase [Chloroflexota bacterium]